MEKSESSFDLRLLRCLVIVAVIFCSFFTAKPCSGKTLLEKKQPVQISLSPAEKAWLAEHREITIAFDGNYAPYSFQNKHGEFNGIAVDFARELAHRVGLRLKVYPEGVWKDLYTAAQEHKVDVIATLVLRPERRQWFEFTRPYLSLAQYIITRKDNGKIRRREDIAGKTVALVKNYSTTRYLLEEFPTVKPYYVDSLTAALEAVSTGEAEATVAAMGMAQHLIAQRGLPNMKFAALYAQGLSEQRFGVRKDWPELATILDKALDSLAEDERLQIFQRWSRPEIARVETVTGNLPTVQLSYLERAWLDAHPEIHVGIMDAWPPMDFLDDLGNPKGIGVDFIEALNKRLDGRLVIVPGPWKKIYEKVKNKQLEAVMDITPRKDRDPYFNFTRAYANIPHVIVARKDGAYYRTVKDLSGKTVALEQDFFIIKYLKENHPDIRIREYANTSDALDAVSKDEADAYAGNRAVAKYLMEKELLANLQVQGKVKATASVNSIGVRKDWPELTAILDRALASLTPNEVRAIYRKWGGIGKDEKLEFRWISLTPEEKAWLNDHPVIRVAADTDWAPVEFVDEDGEFKGVSIDYLKRISKMLGVEFQFTKDIAWNEAMDMLRRRELDIFSAAVESSERKPYATFTEPYLSLPVAVFTHIDTPYIGDLAGLAGRKVAVVRGYAIVGFLKKNYPQIEIIEVKNIPSALTLVESKEAFAYLDTILATSHYIRKKGYSNLKVSGQTDFEYKIAMASRSDWPILAGLLQKALSALSEEESNDIYKKWIAVTYEKEMDYSLIWKILVGVLLLLAVFVYLVRRLVLEMNKRKQALKALAEQAKKIGAGSFEQKVIYESKDDLGQLADSFNKMAEALKSNINSLEENEAKFRALFEASNDAVFIMDTEKFLECNDQTLKVFGCRREDIIGRSPLKFSPSRQPDGSLSEESINEKVMAALHNDRQRFYWQHIRLDGSIFDAEVSLNSTYIANEAFIQAVVQDISERKRAEEALKKAHDELEAKVEERTRNLKEKTDKLERMNRLFVDRELRMKELKKEIEKLSDQKPYV